MERILDLNMEQPRLRLTMTDDARTTINLTLPTEELINQLQNMGPRLQAMRKGDANGIAEIYELASQLISCNIEGLKVTAEELRTTYNMKLASALVFFNAYMDFVTGVVNEKN